MRSAGERYGFQIFKKIVSTTWRQLTVARVCFCEIMAIKIRRSRNLKPNAMSKQTSAKSLVANEKLLYIKSFQYLSFIILNCF